MRIEAATISVIVFFLFYFFYIFLNLVFFCFLMSCWSKITWKQGLELKVYFASEVHFLFAEEIYDSNMNISIH